MLAILSIGVTIATVGAIKADNTSLDELAIRVNGKDIINFDPSTSTYTATLDKEGQAIVSMSAVPAASDATVEITVNGKKLTNHSLAKIDSGDNTIEVKVTSAGTKTYTINVTVPAPKLKNVIYFDNSASNWSQVYVHYYGGTSQSTWPGVAMKPVEGEANIYYYECPEGTTGLVFNANGKPQTGNFTFADKHIYNVNGDQGQYGPKVPVIAISPNGGKVKGGSTISVNISNNPTSVSATFNGQDLYLTPGDNSINVNDYLTSDGATGKLSITAKNEAGTETASADFTRDDSVTPEPTPGDLTGDWRELSIYQIMVASFQHGDGGASGYSDMWGPNGHRKNGNLRGIINSLDYIKDLGMNAIWMTPVFDSTNGMGGEKLQATGYFCTNYFKIDPKFGTEEEFDELVSEAHKRGMYIILDGVFGHHGAGYDLRSPNGKTLKTQDGTRNVRGDSPGNVKFPESLDYFKEVVRYWMNRGVDGWRLDQAYQVYQDGHNYWTDLRKEVEAVAAERKAKGQKWGTLGYMVGEDWIGAGGITVTQQDGLKSVMDFDGKDNLVGLGYGVGSIKWYISTPASTRGYRDSGVNPTIFLSNHDTDRVGDKVDINNNPRGLMLRHAAVAAYSGPTCTYYGDEIGDKSGPGGNPDNWSRTSGRISGFNSNEKMVHDYVSKVFKARAANPALWRGNSEVKIDEKNLAVVLKSDPESSNKVICIFADQNTSVNISGYAPNGGYDLIDNQDVSGSVTIEACVPKFIRVK